MIDNIIKAKELLENAANLNGQPASYYAAQSALAPMIQNVTAIQVVSALPTNPVATTLYLVTES